MRQLWTHLTSPDNRANSSCLCCVAAFLGQGFRPIPWVILVGKNHRFGPARMSQNRLTRPLIKTPSDGEAGPDTAVGSSIFP